MPASDYLDRKLLEWLVTGAAFPAALSAGYLALYTAAPTKAGGGTEVAGGSYARLATVSADWAVTGGGAVWTASNARTLTFPTPTALWGTLAAVGLLDAATAGNLLWFQALAQQRVPAIGQPVVFGLAALQILGRST